jgi:peptidoglycan/LPS O-acetylase OafA/YrhL
MKKRNGIISLWKFIFAVVIVLFHTKAFYTNNNIPVFKYGYIACEFFFIVSGFYFAKSVINEKYNNKIVGKETINFILKKLKVLFPYILITFIIDMIIRIIFLKLNLDTIINSIWNLLLLREIGIKAPLVLWQLWFITSMLISMLIIYPIFKKYKENYIYIASPLIVLFILGYLSKIKVGLDFSYEEWILFTRSGMFRGFAEINIGMIIYLIHTRLKNINYTNVFNIFITILSHLLLIGVLVATTFISRSPRYDYVYLLAIVLAILIMVSEKTLDYKLLSNKFNYYLEKISLPMFITHTLFYDVFMHIKRLSTINPMIRSSLVLLCTIIFSIFLKLIIDMFIKHEVISKIKNRCIIDNRK